MIPRLPQELQKVLLHFLGFQKFSKVHGLRRTFENAKHQKKVFQGSWSVAKPPGYSRISNTSPEILELMGYAKKAKIS
jgi:hypothetical protein